MLKALILFPMFATAVAKPVQLTTTNTVVYKGEVTLESVADVEDKLLKVLSKRKTGETIYLVMDSPGGSISAGEDFIAFAKLIPNLKTISIFSASMASAIVEAMPGKRLITTNGTLMFHRAKGGFQGQFEDGEVESRLFYAKSIVYGMEQRNADRMGKDVNSYKSEVKDEMWLYGIEAVFKGAADELVDVTCSKQLMESDVVSLMNTGFGSVSVIFSGCPLLSRARLADDKADAETQDALKTYLSIYRQSGIFRN